MPERAPGDCAGCAEFRRLTTIARFRAPARSDFPHEVSTRATDAPLTRTDHEGATHHEVAVSELCTWGEKGRAMGARRLGFGNRLGVGIGVASAALLGFSAIGPAAWADPNPPVISAIHAEASVSGDAIVSWTTDEASDSSVAYGLSAASLNSNQSDVTDVTAHFLTLHGLTPGARYFFQVSSTDVADNTATAPVSPASFVVPTFGATDTTSADFSSGTPGSCSVVAHAGDGDVELASTVGEEFSGTGLPAGWSTTPWNPGGGASVSGGALTVDGSLTGTTTTYSAGVSLSFVATFGGEGFEHIGLGTDLNAAPWAIFSTGIGGTLQARSTDGFFNTSADLGAGFIGSPHLFRIDWTANQVVFSIDGTQVSTQTAVITTPMRPLASDFTVDSTSVSVDWLQMTPYLSPCTFVSHTIDAGAGRTWLNLDATTATPSGAGIAIDTRTSDDGATWSAWSPVDGTTITSPNGRYLQYRATLQTTDDTVTPELTSVAVTAMKIDQSISFGTLADATLVQTPVSVAASASSGLTVTFSSTTPSVCTVSGTSVTLVTTGTCSVEADQAGDATYNAAPPVLQSFAVSKASQTISFGTLADKTLIQGPVTVAATATSGLTVTFSSATPSACTVAGTSVTLVANGTCTVQADQAGNAIYDAAPPVLQSFAVSKASQTISFGTLADKTLIQGPVTVAATATSGLTVTFSSATPSACTVAGTSVTLVANGTCTVQADQAGNAIYDAAPAVLQSFAVSKASQTISFGTLADKTLIQGPVTVAATATSGLTVTFSSATPSVCTAGGTNGATITLVANGTCTVEADQAGNAIYNAAPAVQQNFSVSKASQTISFGTLADKTLIQGPVTVAATATSGLTVTFSSATPSVCTVSGTSVTLVANGTCTVGGRPGRQRHLQRGPRRATELLRLEGIPDDLVRHPRRQDTRAITVHRRRDRNVGAHRHLLVGDTVGLHRLRHVGHARHDRHVHRGSGPGRQHHLQRGARRATELHHHEGIPDHHLRSSARQDDDAVAVHRRRDRNVGARGDVLVDAHRRRARFPVPRSRSSPTVPAPSRPTRPATPSTTRPPPCNRASPSRRRSQTITFCSTARQDDDAVARNGFGDSVVGAHRHFSSVTPSVCTVAGTSVTLVANGTCTSRPTRPATPSTTRRPAVQQSFTITKASQTITFGALPGAALAQSPLTVSATASSGLTVTFSSTTPSVCTVAGTAVTLVAIGTCTVQADQGGDATYDPAPTVTQSFSVRDDAGRAGDRHRRARQRFGVGRVHGAREQRRRHDHRLHRVVHVERRWHAGNPHRHLEPDHGHRPDQRQLLHVHGHRDELRGHQRAVGRLEHGGSRGRTGSTDCGQGGVGFDDHRHGVVDGELQRSGRQRRGDHRLHREMHVE